MDKQTQDFTTPRRGSKSRGTSSQPSPTENIFNLSTPPSTYHGSIQQYPMYSPNTLPVGFQQFHSGGFQQFNSGGFQQFNQGGFQPFMQGGFPQYNQGGQFQQLLQQETYSEDVEVDETVPETQPDLVPETQLDAGTTTQRKKKFANRTKAVSWTSEEEVLLANAWLHVSEDSIVGNAQKSGQFWGKILDYFNSSRQHQRNRDQAQSKWADMNKKMMKFNGIYNNLRAQYKSGWGDADFMERAHTMYRADNKQKPFSHETAWRIVKDHPKWKIVHSMDDNPRPSKRSKSTSDSNPNTTSSDARVRFNLNEESHEEEDVLVQEPTRPTGRDKGKRAASSSTKTAEKDEALKNLMEYVEKFNVANNKILTVEEEKLKTARDKAEAAKTKAEALKQREERKKMESKRQDLEFYIRPHDHLTGSALNAVLAHKELLRQLYGW